MKPYKAIRFILGPATDVQGYQFISKISYIYLNESTLWGHGILIYSSQYKKKQVGLELKLCHLFNYDDC